MKKEYRLRIAPSPTGYPHIGTIYQALFNYAYAKKYGGSFIVRIEDTDRTRFVEGAEGVVYRALDWFGLTEDESPRKGGEYAPYIQSERLQIYQQYVQVLIDAGHAYFAYYKKEESGEKTDYTNNSKVKIITETTEEAPKTVSEMLQRSGWVVRLKVPSEGTIEVTDGVRGSITFEYKQVSQQVLLKSDGYPTYHLAVVVDDYLMHISDVVRAEEWISSTPKHVLLYDYFGWEKPNFYHTPDLRNPDKSKLSKRHGHTNVNWYREEGYLPEAILNFLALQGWSHPEGKEVFSLEEFIEVFDLKDIKPSGPIFDLTKLTWMNQHYIQNLSDAELKNRLISFDASVLSSNMDALLPLVKTRIQTLKEYKKLVEHFFVPPEKIEDELHTKIAQHLYTMFNEITEWNEEHILAVLRTTLQSFSIRMPVLYLILTGKEKGLPLPESLVILGKEEVMNRLRVYV